MGLSSDLISQFVKATNDKKRRKTETIVYGTIVISDGVKYVKLDGSDLLTPVETTANTKAGERVTVMIKNHTAMVTGNISSPAARVDDVKGLEDAGEAIEEAGKNATNYINYDTDNGLILGNKRSGSWVGFRTQITLSAFRILDTAGSAVASYGAKLIELGKNATDAVISLCGGKGLIKYDSIDAYIELTGKNVRIRGETDASVYTKYSDSQTSKDYKTNVTAGYLSTNENGEKVVGVTIGASKHPTGDDTTESYSYITLDSLKAILEANGTIELLAFDHVIIGNCPINLNTTKLSVGGDIYDKFDTRVNNGLANYTSSGIDPDTTLDELILTNKNTPMGGSNFMYIRTMFYDQKSVNSNRAQEAFPYNTNGSVYHRYFYNGSWSSWRRHKNADEA